MSLLDIILGRKKELEILVKDKPVVLKPSRVDEGVTKSVEQDSTQSVIVQTARGVFGQSPLGLLSRKVKFIVEGDGDIEREGVVCEIDTRSLNCPADLTPNVSMTFLYPDGPFFGFICYRGKVLALRLRDYDRGTMVLRATVGEAVELPKEIPKFSRTA